MALVRNTVICFVFLFMWAEGSVAVPLQQPSQPFDKDLWGVLGMYPVNGTLLGSRVVKNAGLGCVLYAVFSNDAVSSRGRLPDSSDHRKLTTLNSMETYPNPARFDVFALPRCSVAGISSATAVPPASLFGLKWRLYRVGGNHKRVALAG